MIIRKIAVCFFLIVLLLVTGYGLASWWIRHSSPEQALQAQQASQVSELEKTLAELSNTPSNPVAPLASIGSDNDYELGQRLPGDAPKKKSSEFDPAFPELEWDTLIPANWDPMTAFKGLNVAELQDNDPKAQEALNTMRKAWNEAPINPALAGGKVRIAGFAIPLEQSDKGVDELLLVPYFGACIHTPPPPANQIIHVKLNQVQPAVGAMQAYWVWGVLGTSRYNNELGDAAYQINAAEIEPYNE